MNTLLKLTILSASVGLAFESSSLNASPLSKILAHSKEYQEQLDIEGYWFSEKLDGIRAIWTGKELLTRKGNKIIAPTWFLEGLPNDMLEGELWAGRENFNFVQQTVLAAVPIDLAWKKIVFMLFDKPSSPSKFSQRYNELLNLTDDLDKSHVQVIRQYPIESKAQLEESLLAHTVQKAEGLMLRDPQAIYRQGKTKDIIKLKKHQDSEAVVVGYKAGKGKYLGVVGSLLLQDMQGNQFYVGSGLTDQLRKNPPNLGTVVTYQFNGLTSSGKPRFARFVRVFKK